MKKEDVLTLKKGDTLYFENGDGRVQKAKVLNADYEVNLKVKFTAYFDKSKTIEEYVSYIDFFLSEEEIIKNIIENKRQKIKELQEEITQEGKTVIHLLNFTERKIRDISNDLQV